MVIKCHKVLALGILSQNDVWYYSNRNWKGLKCWSIHRGQHNMVHTLQIHMMTSSNGNIFRETGPLCGEFTGPGEFPTQRPVTQSFDVFFDLRLNKRLSKQPRGWWFETPSWSLWRQCNEIEFIFAADFYCILIIVLKVHHQCPVNNMTTLVQVMG